MEEYTEHDDLVTELADLEYISPEERLAHAKTRRQEQLEAYNFRRSKNNFHCGEKVDHASHDKILRFNQNIELIEAAARDDAEEVEYFLKNGVSADLQNEDGLSALHQSVIEDCQDVVDVLIDYGADLNIKDADLWTPMHAAVACGNYELVKYLVDKNASLVEINTDGNMPIDLVDDNIEIEVYLDQAMSDKGYTEDDLENIRNYVANVMLKDLKEAVEQEKDLNITGEHGETSMHIAAANGYGEVVEYLLDHGAKIDLVDNDHWQPIHAAACWGQDKIIEILVNHGADLDAVTKDGETPIDLTEDEDLQGMIIELKESGHKTKELKRSQSNSSRTLSVRRSSIVEKRQKSLNDAKQEGTRFRQIDIKTDDTPASEPQQISVAIDTSPDEKQIENKQTSNHNTDDPVVKYKPKEERITITDSPIVSSHSSNHKQQVAAETPTKTNDIKIDIKSNSESDLEKQSQSSAKKSRNTAAKNNKKVLSQSTEISAKKKCCVIL